MKQLWVNQEPIEDAEGSLLEAERIEFNDDEIIGYIGRREVFALRALHADINTYEVKDRKGQPVSPDKSELDQLKTRVSALEVAVSER